MKLIMDEDKIILFLNKDINLNEFIKTSFLKLKNKLNINKSFYNIDAYHDKSYGYVLEINYIESYFEQIEVNIIETKFLYEIDYSYLKDNMNFYKYNSKVYIRPKNVLDVIEFVDIIYGEKTKKIIRNGVVKYEKTSCGISR